MRDVATAMISSSVLSISFIIVLSNIGAIHVSYFFNRHKNIASESQAIFQLPVYTYLNVNAMQKSPATRRRQEKSLKLKIASD